MIEPTTGNVIESLQMALRALGAEKDAELSRLNAKISELEKVWQPIETAPKDGSVCIGTNHFVSYHMAWYDKEDSFVVRGFGIWARRLDGSFDKVNPTKWMPRSDAPIDSNVPGNK